MAGSFELAASNTAALAFQQWEEFDGVIFPRFRRMIPQVEHFSVHSDECLLPLGRASGPFGLLLKNQIHLPELPYSFLQRLWCGTITSATCRFSSC